jgi:hypothetical protein
VKEMHSLPRQPDSLVVAHNDLFNLIQYDVGVAIYDHGVQRPNAGRGDSIQVSQAGDTVWGFDNQDTAFSFSKWQVDPRGLTNIASGGSANCYGCLGTSMRCQNNVCFTGSGVILDSSSLAGLGTLSSPLLNSTGWVSPDLDNDRVYFADGPSVMAFQFSSKTLVGSYTIPQATSDINSFLMWHDSLVIGRSFELDIVPLSVLRP